MNTFCQLLRLNGIRFSLFKLAQLEISFTNFSRCKASFIKILQRFEKVMCFQQDRYTLGGAALNAQGIPFVF
ncbi:MAG: hypothetical protein R3D55_08560 [Chloroflexota bacterium]